MIALTGIVSSNEATNCVGIIDYGNVDLFLLQKAESNIVQI